MTIEKTTKARCKALSVDGTPCAMYPTASGYCFNHDPARAGQRAAARKRGGQKRRTPHAGNVEQIAASIASVTDIQTLLDYVRAELLVMDNGIPRARALLALAEMYIKALEIGEHEERIKALEARNK